MSDPQDAAKSPLIMFGDDDAACVDGVCYVPETEAEPLRKAKPLEDSPAS